MTINEILYEILNPFNKVSIFSDVVLSKDIKKQQILAFNPNCYLSSSFRPDLEIPCSKESNYDANYWK